MPYTTFDNISLDWVRQQSDKAIFFYDADQSIKPSDADSSDFQRLISDEKSVEYQLRSQFRVKAGVPYVEFVESLLNCELKDGAVFTSKNYEFRVFESLEDMRHVLAEKEREVGLSRLVAGYSWPWVSKNDPTAHDIVIDGINLRWNSTNTDWINVAQAPQEVGCIHTTQGYDLNYTGVIFGQEIRYDPHSKSIVIERDNYFDRNGVQGVRDPEELKRFVINIYRTLMLRGIRGTFIYACDESLRAYLQQHVPLHTTTDERIGGQNTIETVPFVNSVPLFDGQLGVENFVNLPVAEHQSWVLVPDGTLVHESMFAFRVIGESRDIVKSGWSGKKCRI